MTEHFIIIFMFLAAAKTKHLTFFMALISRLTLFVNKYFCKEHLFENTFDTISFINYLEIYCLNWTSWNSVLAEKRATNRWRRKETKQRWLFKLFFTFFSVFRMTTVNSQCGIPVEGPWWLIQQQNNRLLCCYIDVIVLFLPLMAMQTTKKQLEWIFLKLLLEETNYSWGNGVGWKWSM